MPEVTEIRRRRRRRRTNDENVSIGQAWDESRAAVLIFRARSSRVTLQENMPVRKCSYTYIYISLYYHRSYTANSYDICSLYRGNRDGYDISIRQKERERRCSFRQRHRLRI